MTHTHGAALAVVPADGAVLQAPPARILLRFHAPVEAGPGSLELRDASGRAVPLGRVAQPSAEAVLASVPAGLARGAYTVVFHGRDTSTFSVGQPAHHPAALTLLVCAAVAALALPLGVAARSKRKRVPIAVGALLVLAAPFVSGAFAETHAPPRSRYFTTATRLGPYGLELGVSPDAPGINTIDLLVTDRSGRRADLGAITVTAAHAQTRLRFRPQQLAPGHYAVDLARLASPGTWRLHIASSRFAHTVAFPIPRRS